MLLLNVYLFVYFLPEILFGFNFVTCIAGTDFFVVGAIINKINIETRGVGKCCALA